ncbi:hypothetical protein RI129_006957 [Pyrocoelia pectoralis]|uniref:Uncharacterized protein n=1 Tax=Pyrocoelia pectoralis TaxID=417401 RepID=A0AAN7ZGP1_9COLE
MSTGHNASFGVANSSIEPPTTSSTLSTTISDREQIKIDFYHTYDAMTGIRIAATLGGFFGLMVILIVYKSKSKTEKALEDPKLAAAAVAEAEEEEQRQFQAAMEATVLQDINSRGARRSVDITNSPAAGWLRNARRYSAIGYSGLTEPPIRTPSRLPCFIDEDSPPDEDELEDLSTFNRYLDIPRRSSNITCSSSDSSYLERRGSSVILGLPAVPAHKTNQFRRQSSPLPEQYDFYYPIDIRVIQPTPGGSPCGSERALYDNVQVPNSEVRRAPLASISSCNSSLVADYPDLEMHSLDSDSVFHEDECPDTEDEVDPFSTDSEASDGVEYAWCRRDSKRSLKRNRKSSFKGRRVSIPCISENIPVISEHRESDYDIKPSTSHFSSNGNDFAVNDFRVSVSEHDLNCSEKTPFIKEKRSSIGENDSKLLTPLGRPPYPLPSDKSLDSLTLIGSGHGSTVTLPTLPLAERTSSSSTLKKEGSWSQETLF